MKTNMPLPHPGEVVKRAKARRHEGEIYVQRYEVV
jgi:hypothetical protein